MLQSLYTTYTSYIHNECFKGTRKNYARKIILTN